MKKALAIITVISLLIATMPVVFGAQYGRFMYTENTDGTINISRYYPDEAETGNIVIPSKINGKKVTTIGYQAFKERSIVKTVKIPDTVTTIGTEAFYGCSNLTEVTIGENVSTIGAYAFNSCKALTEIDLVNTKYIGEMSFYGCSSLASVYFGENLEFILKSAFAKCTALIDIEFPETLKYIGEFAFTQCSALPAIILPDRLDFIGTSAFKDCIAAEKVVFGSGELTISPYAFENCIMLTQVYIPNNVISVGLGAFEFRNSNETTSSHPVIIRCHKDSAAFSYAIENGAPAYIIELDKTIEHFGDIDGNGVTNNTDARLALRYASGITTVPKSSELYLTGDLNQNDTFDLEDVKAIMKIANL